MALDTSPRSDAGEEPEAPAGSSTPVPEGLHGPFSLASLLGLNEEELAQPLSRAAPEEHRWERLSLGVTPETGEAEPTSIRSGVASQPPTRETELIPGIDVPGAVEVPVYLAGRTLHEMLHNTPPSTSTADATPRDDSSVDHVAASAAGTPVRPPAISVTGIGRPRKRIEAPTANFSKAERVAVLWPKEKPASMSSSLPQECARCGAGLDGERCAACGNDTAVSARARRSGAWNDIIASFLESDSRAIRTIGALILAPGELTTAFLGGHRRRYFSPTVVGAVALLTFAVISAIGGLRPRPDRALMIGSDRTVERLGGLADARPVNLAMDTPPDLVRDVAAALDFIPLLWLLLLAFGVVAVVAASRTFQQHPDHAEMVYATHFTAWFVVWWGLVVPVILLGAKFGFEYAAAWQNVTHIRYLENGGIDGVSAGWNAMRGLAVSPALHSALLAVGLIPWAVRSYRRTFKGSWARAAIAGSLVAAVPVLLLTPFG